MKLRFLCSLLMILIISSSKVLAQSQNTHHEKPRIISVTGTAKLKSPPDKATVRFAIKNLDKVAEKARTLNNETSKIVLNAVRQLGIPEKKIHLENLSIQEEREYNGKTNEFKGYSAYRVFRVDIEKPDLDSKTLSEKIAEVVAAVISNGSNQLESIQFGLIDQSKLIDEALALAIQNARDKAEATVKAIGATLGKVYSISESTSEPYARSYMSAKTMAFDARVASVESEPESFSEGDLEVNSTINATFEIL